MIPRSISNARAGAECLRSNPERHTRTPRQEYQEDDRYQDTNTDSSEDHGCKTVSELPNAVRMVFPHQLADGIRSLLYVSIA
jgi:hypothetical protein